MQRFEATIESGAGGGAYVAVPDEVVAALGGGGRIPVAAAFDGVEYRGSIADMGSGPCLGVLKAIRTELGKQPGDRVVVTVARDDAERTIDIPVDLAAALRTAGLTATFDNLSFSRRREHVTAVTETKRAETRARRITKVVESLS
ncbi:YdeI/OmpD-associated family protein [Nocardia sp. NPDC051756]|uniref:YdeI/OmpD-associated family protein n=1 Tax=Nocardia sp. NPDC051756 TaxID=3154751 RepID=UPI0034334D88